MLEREQLLKVKTPKGAGNVAAPATEQHNAKDEKDMQSGAANNDKNKSRTKGEDVTQGKIKGRRQRWRKIRIKAMSLFQLLQVHP